MAGYGDDTSYGTWLTENGLPAPADGVAVAVLRQRGSTYLDGLYGPKFSGQPTDGFAQDRAWPRVGAEAHCQPIPSDLVPLAIVHASYFAAHQEQTQPGSLSVAATAAGAVKRRKIDVVEIEFSKDQVMSLETRR